MSNTALILGAGAGTRMGMNQNKLLLSIGGQTVLERSVSAFYRHPMVDRVVVVCREDDLPAFRTVLYQYDRVLFTLGGATRQQSVVNALQAVPGDTKLLIIHDGARPLVTDATITATLECAAIYRAAATGVPVKDTIKVIDKNGVILDTPDRASLFSIQTPQVFDYPLYLKAVAQAEKDQMDFTDDCQLIEYIGLPVHTVAGDYGNLKITTQEDIPMAVSILNSRGEM